MSKSLFKPITDEEATRLENFGFEPRAELKEYFLDKEGTCDSGRFGKNDKYRMFCCVEPSGGKYNLCCHVYFSVEKGRWYNDYHHHKGTLMETLTKAKDYYDGLASNFEQVANDMQAFVSKLCPPVSELTLPVLKHFTEEQVKWLEGNGAKIVALPRKQKYYSIQCGTVDLQFTHDPRDTKEDIICWTNTGWKDLENKLCGAQSDGLDMNTIVNKVLDNAKITSQDGKIVSDFMQSIIDSVKN
jgi:hypothetical protein